MTEQANAVRDRKKGPWTIWLESEDGRRCASTMPTDLRFLEHRLWWAFMAGMEAVRKNADQESK